MRKRLYVLALLLLILTTHVAFGDGNKTKLTKNNHKINLKGKTNDRLKRSVNEVNNDKQFWTNRKKRQITDRDESYNDNDMEETGKILTSDDKFNHELPFWGNRGRRSSEENYVDFPYADIFSLNNDFQNHRLRQKLSGYPGLKDRREDSVPFWGNRGRRSSDEIVDDGEGSNPFWSSRGRRQDDEPFWGTRGRRESNLPFWGNRGRRDEEPFWGNRGRRQENEPFWGNRGRRQDEEPFWGNRGKKEDVEPFWGNRGKKEIDDSEPFWGNRGRRKEDLKESIIAAIDKVETDIDNLSRLKRSKDIVPNGNFWLNRGRYSQLQHLFDGSRLNNQHLTSHIQTPVTYDMSIKPPVASTFRDGTMYADQPHYIVVERSSRSSAELDPFYISRGKKKKIFQPARGRRGALEEIVKSVKNDPFYIARGKKDIDVVNASMHDEFLKVKELICATIDLMLTNNENRKVKREMNENDRDRRNILKKLAAQLQNDPYFVSRGKKNDTKENDIEDFVSHVATMCH